MNKLTAAKLANHLTSPHQRLRLMKVIEASAPSFYREDGAFKMSEFLGFLNQQGFYHIRSETAQQNEDDFNAARAAGFEVKEWDANNDGKQRVEHGLRDGERRNIDERFSVQFENSFGPMFPRDPNAVDEDVCNCRCTLVYWMENDLH